MRQSSLPRANSSDENSTAGLSAISVGVGTIFSFGENTDDSIIDCLPPVVSQKAVVAKMREVNQTNQEPIYEFSEIHCSPNSLNNLFSQLTLHMNCTTGLYI